MTEELWRSEERIGPVATYMVLRGTRLVFCADAFDSVFTKLTWDTEPDRGKDWLFTKACALYKQLQEGYAPTKENPFLGYGISFDMQRTSQDHPFDGNLDDPLEKRAHSHLQKCSAVDMMMPYGTINVLYTPPVPRCIVTLNPHDVHEMMIQVISEYMSHTLLNAATVQELKPHVASICKTQGHSRKT